MTQCCCKVEPPSATLAQHYSNIVSLSRVCWEGSTLGDSDGRRVYGSQIPSLYDVILIMSSIQSEATALGVLFRLPSSVQSGHPAMSTGSFYIKNSRPRHFPQMSWPIIVWNHVATSGEL